MLTTILVIPVVILAGAATLTAFISLYKRFITEAYAVSFSMMMKMAMQNPEQFRKNFIEENGQSTDHILRELKKIKKVKKMKLIDKEIPDESTQSRLDTFEMVADTDEDIVHSYKVSLKSDGKISKIVSLEKVS